MNSSRAPAWLLLVGICAASSAITLSMATAEDNNDRAQWKAPARDAQRGNPVAADEQSIAAGHAFYRKECASCHGAKGKGDGVGAKDLSVEPTDLSDPSMWNQSDGELFWKITYGRKPMPAFAKRFNDDQRWQIINYIRTLAPRPQSARARPSSEGDSK
jgi:mono/diheme cytochrome c family protein